MLLFYLSLLETQEEKSKMENLYYTYRGLMLKVAYDILRDFELANDALHTSFLKIVNHLDKIEEISCPKTKVYMDIVVENVSKNMYNKRKKRYEVPLEQVENEIAESIDIGEAVEDKMTVEYIYKLIKLLPPMYSEILTLKYTSELTDKQISEILGISTAATRKRLERARKKLIELMNMESK